MSSSSDRGQVEPLAALAAVFALGAGLALYAGALDATVPSLTPDRDPAPAAADRVVDASTSAGVVEPPIERAAATARPTGRELNATLRATGWDEEWRHGPPVPETVDVDCARREVGVRVAPGDVRPGRMGVCVWPADGE